MENVASSNITPEGGSGVCVTCHKLLFQVFFSILVYTSNVASDTALGVLYVWGGDTEEGISTLLFVILPLSATLLVNYVDKWCHRRAHKCTHSAVEELRREAELKCKLEDRNAAILEDVVACFESTPQLVLQLSLIFRDIATFDGDLLRVANVKNGLKLFTILTSAFSYISVFYGRIEHKEFQSRNEYLQERMLAVICIFSRVMFVLGYSIIASVSSPWLVPLAASHWIAMIVLLLRGPQPRGTHLSVLEALLHVFQYITWCHREDARAAVRALTVTSICECLLVLAGLVYVVMTTHTVYQVYIVGAITYTFLFLLFVLFVCRFSRMTVPVT